MRKKRFRCKRCHKLRIRKCYGSINGNRNFRCLKCCAKAVRKTYRTSIAYRQSSKDGRQRRSLEKHRFLYAYTKKHPCVDCGETDPLVLQFDHIKGKKLYDIPGMTLFSFQKIKKEIKKCVVRCANDHARKTAKERNSVRYQLVQEDLKPRA